MPVVESAVEAVFFFANLYQRVALYLQRDLLDFDLWAALDALNLCL